MNERFLLAFHTACAAFLFLLSMVGGIAGVVASACGLVNFVKQIDRRFGAVAAILAFVVGVPFLVAFYIFVLTLLIPTNP
jgi:hypothetical protein